VNTKVGEVKRIWAKSRKNAFQKRMLGLLKRTEEVDGGS